MHVSLIKGRTRYDVGVRKNAAENNAADVHVCTYVLLIAICHENDR